MKITKEQRMLVMMRKVLSNVIKDATPQPGDHHPLSQETLDDIKSCFGFIVTREKELQAETGLDAELTPRYVDEVVPQKVQLTVAKPKDS